VHALRQAAEQPVRPDVPSKSQIGTGSADVNASPITPAPNGRVTAYIGGANKIILVVKPTLGAYASQITVIGGHGLGLDADGAGPADGDWRGQEEQFCGCHRYAPVLGSGRSALITAGRCTAHKFVVKSHFVYANHSKLDLKSSSRCR
jgi:hypothetical protein